MNIKEMIEKAEKAGACKEGVEWARQFDSVEGMLASDFNGKTIDYLHWYARDIIKGRWKEAEPVISTDPRSAYLYARDVIKGRWKEAESIILTYPLLAYSYSRDVIKCRWKEAESIISTKPVYKEYYEAQFNCKLGED